MFTIEGDPDQPKIWEGITGCPLSGERAKSIFCRYRDECELLKIYVRAEDSREAKVYIDYAAATGQIPNCKFGKPFLTKMFGETIYCQPHDID